MLFCDRRKQGAGLRMHPSEQLPVQTALRRGSNETNRRREKGVKDLFDGGTPLSRLPFVFIEQLEPFLIQGFQTTDNHRLEQCFLRPKVIVDSREINFRGGNDGTKRGLAETLVGKHLLGNVEDALFGVGRNHTTDSIIRLNECQFRLLLFRNPEDGAVGGRIQADGLKLVGNRIGAFPAVACSRPPVLRESLDVELPQVGGTCFK